MVSFKKRSSESELMDGKGIPRELLHHNLEELDILNRHLGGHSISMEGIKQLLINRQKTWHIVDLGCGSGDVLKYIARWARTNSYKVKLTGVDVNRDAINYLSANCSDYPEISGVVSDYKDYLLSGKEIDIVHCSLFCHHLDDKELLDLFRTFKLFASGFVINDLQRNILAYWGAWLMPRLLNGTTLSKHDGPVSVLRAFKKNELLKLLREAGINEISIKRRWAFRYLVVAKTD